MSGRKINEGIIDFHTHIFPDRIAEKTISMLAEKSDIHPYANGTENGLKAAMERGGVSLSIALPPITKPSQFDSVNAYAEEVNRRNEEDTRRIISFGGIHPACEDIDGKMKQLALRGFKGVKIHPDYQDEFIDSPRYIRILECAKEYGLIAVTHAGYDNGFPGLPVKCPPDRLKSVLKAVRYDKIVLAHYGGHLMWKDVLELLTDCNVYFDTAYTLSEIEPDLFKRILDRIGVDRVLFATDSPWRDIKTEADILRSYRLGEEAENKIFRENALKLLGL